MPDELRSLVVSLAMDASQFDTQITATAKKIKSAEAEMKAAAAEALALGKGLDAAKARADYFKQAVEAQQTMVQAWRKKLDETNATLEKNKQKLAETGTRLKAAEADHKKLAATLGKEAQEVIASKDALEKLKKEHADAAKQTLASENAVSRVSTAYATSREKLVALNAEMKKANAEFAKQSNGLLQLGNRMEALGTSIGKSGQHITDFGKKLSTASTLVTALGTGAVLTFATFDDAMRQVLATMGAGEEEYARLTAAAEKYGAETRFSAKQSAEALNYLALAGYDTNKAIDMLPKVLNLAAAGNFDLALASDMVTDAMSALGLEISYGDTFIDQMARTSQKSNTSVAQLGEAILAVGGTAKVLRGGTAELNRDLGLLADNGIKGAESGTKLRNILLSLSAPTSAAQKQFQALGVELIGTDGELRDTADIFRDLSSAVDGMSDAKKLGIMNELFNKTDLAAVNALLGTTQERFAELGGEIVSSQGAAQQMAETLEGGLGGDFRELQSAIEGVAIVYGRELSPTVQSVTRWITDLGNQFAALDGHTKQMIVRTGLAVAAAAPAIIAVGKVTSGIGSVISTGGKLAAFLATNPWAIGIIGMGAFFLTASKAADALDSAKQAVHRFTNDVNFTPFERDVESATALIAELPIEVARASEEAQQQMSNASGHYMASVTAVYTDGKRESKKQLKELDAELGGIIATATGNVESSTQASYDAMYRYYENAGMLESEEAKDVLAKITKSGEDKKVQISTIEDEILLIQQTASKEKRDLTEEEIAKIKEYLDEIEAINGSMLATYDRQMEIVKAQVQVQAQTEGITPEFAASAQKSATAAYTGNVAMAQSQYDNTAGELADAKYAGAITDSQYNVHLLTAKAQYDSAITTAKQSLGETQALIADGLAQNYPEMTQQLQDFQELYKQREEAQANLNKNAGDYRQVSTIQNELNGLDQQIAASLDGLDRNFTETFGSLVAESAANTGQVTTDVANTLDALAGMLTLVKEEGGKLTPGEEMVLKMAKDIDDGKLQVVDAAAAVGSESALAMDASVDSETAGANTVTGNALGIETAKPLAVDAATTVGTESAGAMDATTEAHASGVDTADGYIDGIESKTEAAKKAGAELASAAMGGLNKKAEINSPSRATRRSGRFTGDGYIFGMEDRLPAVRRMGAELAAASLANEQHARQFAALQAASVYLGVSRSTPAPVAAPVNQSYNNQRTVVQHLTINSPTPLSPAEVARQAENAARRAAMGLT